MSRKEKSFAEYLALVFLLSFIASCIAIFSTGLLFLVVTLAIGRGVIPNIVFLGVCLLTGSALGETFARLAWKFRTEEMQKHDS